MPPNRDWEFEKQLDQMLTNGVCRLSHSVCRYVFLANKWDVSHRFAIYYRNNSLTKKDAYSLQNIRHILDKLGVTSYFSSIDIASANCCAPVKYSDVEKTSFHTPRVQHEIILPLHWWLLRLLTKFQGTHGRLEGHAIANPRGANKPCFAFFDETSGPPYLLELEVVKPTSEAVEWLNQFPEPNSLKELQRFLDSLNCDRRHNFYVPLPRKEHLEYGTRIVARRSTYYVRNLPRNQFLWISLHGIRIYVYIESEARCEGVGAVLSQQDRVSGRLIPIYIYLRLSS